mmetsp:Transcript_33736/g.24769  ORF Transcript_33736/g.24769 Transcript_33736/m.24769 type:complete len:120 (+) Transcript_33736:435-794(+)
MFFKDFESSVNVELIQQYIETGVYHVVAFLFDLTDEDSFNKLEDWFDLYHSKCKSSMISCFAIVGTKLDQIVRCPSKRAIKRSIIEEWVTDVEDEIQSTGTAQSVKYFEVSAFDLTNIQ